MKKRNPARPLILFPLLLLLGCAGMTPPPPSPGKASLIPLSKVNLKAVLEEQEGLAITWEDAKDLRDFYRGGVQKKARAEEDFREKKYEAALELYDSSNEFFRFVLRYDNQDSVDFPLFEGTNIFFFPNLLMADNDLKMGRILREMGKESSARRKWMQSRHFLRMSLMFEPTEWGASLQEELTNLLQSPSR